MIDPQKKPTLEMLKADVPAPKMQQMKRSVKTGGMFVGIGVLLLGFMIFVFYKTSTLSIPLLTLGVAFCVLGGHITSGQVVSSSIQSLRESLKGLLPFQKGVDE